MYVRILIYHTVLVVRYCILIQYPGTVLLYVFLMNEIRYIFFLHNNDGKRFRNILYCTVYVQHCIFFVFFFMSYCCCFVRSFKSGRCHPPWPPYH